MADDFDRRIVEGTVTAERAAQARRDREIADLHLEQTGAEQRRMKARGHVEAARGKLRELQGSVGRKLADLLVPLEERMKLSLPFIGAAMELQAALDELQPEKPAGWDATPEGNVVPMRRRP